MNFFNCFFLIIIIFLNLFIYLFIYLTMHSAHFINGYISIKNILIIKK